MRPVCPSVAWRARSTRSGCRLCGPIRKSDQGSGATSTWQTTASSLAPGIGVRGNWWHQRIIWLQQGPPLAVRRARTTFKDRICRESANTAVSESPCSGCANDCSLLAWAGI